MSNVTAFVLDETVSAAADGATIPGVPGVWQYDRPVLASAIGYTVEEMRATIEELNLPLKEVKVPEGKAFDSFPEDPAKMGSSQLGPGGSIAPSEPLEADPAILDHTLDLKDEIEERQLEEVEE